MSIVKVAKVAGVSHATVSRVINNQRNVAPETAMKVKRVMMELEYFPKPVSMRRGPRKSGDAAFRTGNIAFLTCSDSTKILTSSPVMGEVLHGVETALADCGMTMIHATLGASRPLPPLVARGEVDGVIIWPNLDSVPEDTIEILRSRKIIYLMNTAEDRLPGDRVKHNNLRIGRMAADFLISRGHRKLAYITPTELADHNNSMGERWHAFSVFAERKEVAAHQLVIEHSIFDMLDVDEERDRLIGKQVEELLGRIQPTGLFVTCDSLTAQIHPILKKLGIVIGKDLELISCNNETSILAGLDPRPHSIDIQPEIIGQRAVEQLRWRITHPNDESQITIEIAPRLI